jgi:hypothetical protein
MEILVNPLFGHSNSNKDTEIECVIRDLTLSLYLIVSLVSALK